MHFSRTILIFTFVQLLIYSSFCSAELLVIANAKFHRDSLEQQEVKDLFLGKIDELDQVSIAPVDQDDDSEVKIEFFKKVAKKSPRQLTSHWSRMIFSGRGVPLFSVGSDEDVIAWVISNEDAIGYIDASSLAKSDSIKVLFRVD